MKKTLLSLMLILTMTLALAGCGSNDSKESKEDKEEVTATVTPGKEDGKNDADFSGDGGAPVDSETPGTNTETDTEVVEPVSTTFTLVDEDGTVVFEGNVPANLTLVDGNGTSHIEFAYNENPTVSVYLDAGLDYDVLSAVKCNSLIWGGGKAIPQEHIDSVDALIAANNISEDNLGFTDEMHYNTFYIAETIKVNGTNNHMYMAMVENYIGSESSRDENGEYINTYFVPRYDEYNGVKELIPVEDPDTSEYGYILLKATSVKTDSGIPESPFTLSLRINQPDVSTLSNEEITTYYNGMTGYTELSGLNAVNLFTDIIKSFSN